MATTLTLRIAGKAIGSIGYGLMSLTIPGKGIGHADAAKVMKAALEQGANFWNGGLHYGTADSNSLHLLKYYFTQYPEDVDKVVISIKGAYNYTTHQPEGTPEGIRASVEKALQILDGVKKIDVFEMARLDPTVPVETSVKALADLVAEGKIGGIGLSEVSAATIRRAHAVHPIAAVENELSLFTTDQLTNGVLETCHELNIALIAYSPLSRGFMTGAIRSYSDIPENDWRRFLPRFQPAVFNENLKLVDAVEKIAKRKSVTVAQVAISWVRLQGAVPIPSATTVARVNENLKVVELSQEDLEEIEEILKRFEVKGERYGGEFEKLLDQ